MSVPDHQPQRKADSALVCTLPLAGDRPARARTVDGGHGRIATCQRTTRAALGGSSAWPGLAQGFEVGRPVLPQHTDPERGEVG